MELLVVTLAYITPGRDEEALARLQPISDTVRNAPGLIIARSYRSRGSKSYYLMLTTWEDEESWRKAQERYNPRRLLLGTATELLIQPPEQWLMHYLWGYSRPAAVAVLAAAHLATIRPDQAERTQRGWIESLRRQAIQPVLSFAFLARGDNEDMLISRPAMAESGLDGSGNPVQDGAVFLNLLSWASEADREEFYVDVNYKAISLLLENVGSLQILTLEPLPW
ncbi:MAG: antibiotic biosynthesis monooxygenase family protein [Ktedonobacteraceae bacterium]